MSGTRETGDKVGGMALVEAMVEHARRALEAEAASPAGALAEVTTQAFMNVAVMPGDCRSAPMVTRP